MAIDAGTAAVLGVGGTTVAALMGVVANLRINNAQVSRQTRADDSVEADRTFVRLEKENERLTAALDAERAAHQQTRAEVLKCREDNSQLRAENTVLTVGLVEPAKKAPPRKRSGR